MTNFIDKVFSEKKKLFDYSFSTNEKETIEAFEILGKKIYEILDSQAIPVTWLAVTFNSLYFNKLFIIPKDSLIGLKEEKQETYQKIREWVTRYKPLSIAEILLHERRSRYLSFGLYFSSDDSQHGANFQNDHFYYIFSEQLLKKISEQLLENRDLNTLKDDQEIIKEFRNFLEWLKIALPDIEEEEKYRIFFNPDFFKKEDWILKGLGLIIAYLWMNQEKINSSFIYYVPISSPRYSVAGINFATSKKLSYEEINKVKILVDEFLTIFAFSDFFYQSNKYALRSAVSTIMARNMSHNIGSHVLNYLSNPEELNNLWII
jgi:hypothetical protein